VAAGGLFMKAQADIYDGKKRVTARAKMLEQAFTES